MRTLLVLVTSTLMLSACPGDDEDPSGMAGGGGTAGQVAGQGAAGTSGTAGSGVAGNSAGTGGSGGAGTGASGHGGSGVGGSDDADASVATDASADADQCALPCEAGMHCELVQVTCIQAPCPPLPECVLDAANGGGTVDCDPRKIRCRVATPACSKGEVPSIAGTCYGPCVPIESCACNEAAACPDASQYTCHMSAGHCGPYVN